MASNNKGGCPICGKPADDKVKPFCSTRCRQVDLNRWLSEFLPHPRRGAPGRRGRRQKSIQCED